jgi:hypothetical protein
MSCHGPPWPENLEGQTIISVVIRTIIQLTLVHAAVGNNALKRLDALSWGSLHLNVLTPPLTIICSALTASYVSVARNLRNAAWSTRVAHAWSAMGNGVP